MSGNWIIGHLLMEKGCSWMINMDDQGLNDKRMYRQDMDDGGMDDQMVVLITCDDSH